MIMKPFIIFRTKKSLARYIRRNSKYIVHSDGNYSQTDIFIDKSRVIRCDHGSTCACGCGRGYAEATVIGKIAFAGSLPSTSGIW